MVAISVRSTSVSILVLILSSRVGYAVTDEEFAAMKARVADLEKKAARVDELERQVDEKALSAQRAAEIRSIVEETLSDVRQRETSKTPPTFSYENGFVFQTPDNNYKLVIGGVLQARYEYAGHHVDRSRFPGNVPLAQGDTENASGFDIRRARLNLSGYVFSPNLFYRLEGDFFGSATGGFTVTDAFIGYAFNDQFKVRAGAFKTPFTKSEQEYDANLELERPEVNFPFDAQRSIGVSIFGDLIKDRLTYEINANDGSKSNTLRYVDTASNVTTITNSTTPAYNLDNRMAFYARVQYAGAGVIKEFYDGGEADLRANTDSFIWMVGGAVGYESQNSSAATFPQNTLTVAGLRGSRGFTKAYVLNGDIYRATMDWSAKWQGWSFNTAGYFQEINANPYAGTTSGGLPAGSSSSFYQAAAYGQVGYMLMPRRLEILARAGFLLDQQSGSSEFYTLGMEYYLFGNNAKILADINYTPHGAFTDASSLQIVNTQEVVFRLQFQVKF